MLPESLYEKQRLRHHELLKDLLNHLQKTNTVVGFMGKNWDSFEATIDELKLQAGAFNQKYSKDHMIAEEPNVKSLSAWKNERELQEAG